MESFKVGFYKDVFENGKFNFEDCEEIEASFAIDAAQEFAMNQYYDFDSEMNGVGNDDYWDEDTHSVMVKDKDGNIDRFSVYISMEPHFKCEWIS